MAYVSKERKAARAPVIKAVLKKYGLKGTLKVETHSTLVVTIRSGELDLIGMANNWHEKGAERRGDTFSPYTGHVPVNVYWDGENARKHGEPVYADIIDELVAALKGDDWYDNSDAMTDYFNTAFYYDIAIGDWDKPYVWTKAPEKTLDDVFKAA